MPTGLLLVHVPLLKAMWEESPEYRIRDQVTRRVWETPMAAWFDPESNQYRTQTGTSDLTWCDRVRAGGYLAKAGWGDFAAEHPEYPFLVDTNIMAIHIDQDGTRYP